MAKYIMAALMGFITGIVLYAAPVSISIATSTAVVVASIFFCEATIIEKIEGKKEAQKK